VKKYRLQEGVARMCFKCGKKILSKDDMAWYDHRIYHQKCALTLLDKIKEKVFEKMLGGKKL